MLEIADAPEAPPELPLDLIDEIVRLCGWRTWGRQWSKVCKRYNSFQWWREEGEQFDQAHLVVVPDDAPTIKTAIAQASHRAETGQRAVVLVRPGIYTEAIRVTADICVCALGPRGCATIHAPGWEPALAWGGFKVGVTRMGGVTLNAASAGATSEVNGLTLVQRNQSQMVAVYCTFGSPVISHCDIVGSVRVAGRAAAPDLFNCQISHSRSVGLEFLDHARGRVEKCVIHDNRLAAIRLAATATPSVCQATTAFRSNGYDGIFVRGSHTENLIGSTSAGSEDDEEDCCYEPNLNESGWQAESEDDEWIDPDMWRSEGATDSRDDAGRLVAQVARVDMADVFSSIPSTSRVR